MQLPGAVQHQPEANPAPDNELHRDPALGTRDLALPQCLLAAPQGLRQRRQPDRYMQAGAHQTGGRLEFISYFM